MRTPLDKERGYKICTGCGNSLPRERTKWGLVWESCRDHGMCKPCLYAIRKAIGLYEKNPELEAQDRPPKK